MISFFRRWMDYNNLVLIFISVYFILSVIKIEHPGVNNDQLMFVNAATLKEDDVFIWKRFHEIPTMVFPYIGALKSYLYMPIFQIFGVNIWSIRLPQIILICISWLLLYKALTFAFNKKLAILAIVFLSLDPSIIAYSKIDQGPTVLEFFLKILSIYFLYLYLSTKKAIFYFCVFPILSLGIFNKINFFWFVNAYFLGFLIIYWKTFYNDFKRFDKILPFLLVGLPYFFLLRLFIKLSRETALSYKNFSDETSLTNIFPNLPMFLDNLSGIINGDLFFNTVYGINATNIGTYFSFLIYVLLFIGMGFLIFRRISTNILYLRSYYFFALIVAGMILQILLTKRAVSAWHALSIYPFFTVILAAGIYHTRKYVFGFLVMTIIFYQLAVNYIYIEKYGSPAKSVAYSSSIYNLIDFAKNSRAEFICLDVDICNQLLSFTQQREKYIEPFSFLDPPTYGNSFIKISENFKNPSEYLYVSHGELNSHFPQVRIGFFKYLKENNTNFVKVKEFIDGENVSFEVYKIGNF